MAAEHTNRVHENLNVSERQEFNDTYETVSENKMRANKYIYHATVNRVTLYHLHTCSLSVL